MARNVFGLALLAALALSGCSKLDNLPFLGNKKAKAAEAQAAALRARTDSLRKARRIADSLAQVRYVSCVDSIRAELVKPPVAVVKKTKASRKQKPPAPPSEELIAAQAQHACGSNSEAPLPTLAGDSGKPSAVATAQPAPAQADSTKAPAQAPVAAAPSAVQSDSVPALPVVNQAAWADSVQKSNETEMYRETFAYSGSIRDPFNSLLNMAKAGPEVADLQLVGIYQNMRSPSGNVAVFREKEGGKRHKLRAGDQLGRSRVVQIRERDVVFMIEDFGFERQETLSLRKQEDGTP
ncbi:MAG TPA: hypothetical protein VNO19_03685 [Gemmatimonadales bacterium]|nr:hypothetical protein [Gemmatimonadales bacterium]